MKFLRFAVVGAIGFIVDATMMLLLSFYMPVIAARAVAFWAAASSNWWLNRHFTFASCGSAKPLRQWRHFLIASCIGFIPNWGCYWLLMQWVDINLLITAYPESNFTALLEQLWLYLAMLPGIALGMLSNYQLAERWVFLTDTVKD